MKKIFGLLILLSGFLFLNISYAQSSRFDSELSNSVESLGGKLEHGANAPGAQGIKDVVIEKMVKIFIPAVIIFAVLLGILGFYKIMFSAEAKEIEKGRNFIIWGVVGIIVMVSGKYIGDALIGSGSGQGVGSGIFNFDRSFATIAEDIYNKLIFPFLNLFIYLAVGILFIVLLISLFKYIVAPTDDIQKHSKNIIIWNIIGIILILSAKNIVTLIFGEKGNFDNLTAAGGLKQIGVGGIMANKDLSWVHTIINWATGFISLIILVIIVFQSYLLLTKPDDKDMVGKIKKSFIYIFIGFVLIGAGYLITNFLIMK